MPDDADPPRRPLRTGVANLWRVRGYVRPHLASMLGMFAAAAGATGASIAVPLVIRRVVDGPVLHRDAGGLVLFGLLAAVLGLLEALLTFLRRWTQSRVALEMEYQMRADLYAHLQRLPISFHDRWQTGQLLSRATTNLGVIRRFMSFGLIFLVINLATYLVVVVLLLRLYWPLGIVVAASAVPLYLASRRFTRDYHAVSRLQQDQQGDLATLVEESAQGIRAVKAFGRHRHMAERFGASARHLHDTGVRKARLTARGWARFDVIPNVTLAVVLVGGTWAVADGQMTVGALVAFVSLQLGLVWPIDALGRIIAQGQEAMTAADRVYEVFDVPPSIVDAPGAVVLDPPDPEEPPGRRGHLRFEGVSFRYPGAPAQVLRHIDLDIRPGETMALVGITGSGKPNSRM